MRQRKRQSTLDGALVPNSKAFIRDVLERTKAALAERPAAKKEALSFAIYFARYAGEGIATALEPLFPGIKSGENPSMAVRGPKRLDVNYSTPETGLGFAISFKSVHFGEADDGNRKFIHNLKRNDEELRVEATAHHLRQPYAVLVALVFLPFQSCTDIDDTSSFARWVEYLWPLRGRTEPEDPPDCFELVYIGLYARDGSEFGLYEVGGEVRCPRKGRPQKLLSLAEFLQRIRLTYDRRNGRDFYFEGEEPT